MSSTKILHQAIVNRDVALIKRILEEEDSWQPTDDQGETVLHLAYKCKHKSFFLEKSIVATLECLLDEGLSINLKNTAGRTVLFLAVENRFRHVTDFLVQRGANVNARDRNGNTIVHFLIEDQPMNSHRGLIFQKLIEQDHIDSVSWLLSTGVDVHARNNDGKTAFNLAILRNLKYILPTLIRYMKDVNYIVEDGSTIIESLFQTRNINTTYGVQIIDSLLAFVNHVDKKGSTLVHTFLKGCGRNREIVQKILQRYTNVNVQDQDGNTALYLVINNSLYDSRQNLRPTIDAIRTLLSKGADVNLINRDGDTAAHLAVRIKDLDVVKTLLECGADMSPSANPEALLLHDISSGLSIEDEVWAPMVDTLVQVGWDVNVARPGDDFTPLMEACRSSCPAIAQKLIDNGANVNYAVKQSLTRPIHVAAMSSHANQGENTEALFKMLAKAGAKVNVKNILGETALHLAAHCDCHSVGRLLKSGANVDARDKCGRLPLHETTKRRNIGAIKALLQFGAEINDVVVLRELNKLLMIEQVDDEIQILPDPNFNFVTPEKQATVDCLAQHWLKLKAANLPVMDVYADFTKKESLQQYYVECLREVETLKTHRLNDRTTIYDLLHMDVNVKYVFIAKRLKELVQSPLLATNFPKYWYVILAWYYKALSRYPLIEPAMQAWNDLTGIRLPDCVEQILVYLDNDDLRVMAGKEEEAKSLKRSLRMLSEPAKRKRLK